MIIIKECRVMKKFKYCPKCGDINWYSPDTCRFCKAELIETDMVFDFNEWCEHEQEITQQIYKEYKIIENPLYDEKAAEKTKERLKLIEQQSHISTGNSFSITCPNCKSTNVQKLSTASKVVGVGLFGLASKTVGKTYKCNKCGYHW